MFHPQDELNLYFSGMYGQYGQCEPERDEWVPWDKDQMGGSAVREAWKHIILVLISHEGVW